ncbi:MAG TPA: phosphoribosylformylglycinamidine synthase subunit PurS, partial [Propionibacteriaceae bacterium]|nr:phosphoribosylformylglycinamidine synthase subunit PurS [Propionibacteriaceae bacterium]
VDEAKLAEIYSAAEKLLANTVIESFDIRVEQ